MAKGLVVVLLAGAVLAPELVRRNVLVHDPSMARAYSYPLWGEWPDRLLNQVRGAARHFPVPVELGAALQMPLHDTAVGSRVNTTPLRPHEDLAGSPVQVALIGAGLLWGLRRLGSLPSRSRQSLAFAVAGGLLFHGLFRDNPWIQRLQLSVFALCLCCVSPVLAALGSRKRLVWVGLLLGLGGPVAYDTAIGNLLRPPLLGTSQEYVSSYYNAYASQETLHTTTLSVATSERCRRLGLRISNDSYDYALTWRAMQLGIETRHLLQLPSEWPCLIYTDMGPLGDASWLPAAGVEQEGQSDAVFLYRRRPPVTTDALPRGDDRPRG